MITQHFSCSYSAIQENDCQPAQCETSEGEIASRSNPCLCDFQVQCTFNINLPFKWFSRNDTLCTQGMKLAFILQESSSS